MPKKKSSAHLVMGNEPGYFVNQCLHCKREPLIIRLPQEVTLLVGASNLWWKRHINCPEQRTEGIRPTEAAGP